MSVEIKIDIKKSVPGFELEVKQTLAVKGVTAIFGPSGAGKTTLLRIIAGLDIPDTGQICVDGEIWTRPAHKRPAGYMFQDGRLFEHLTVQGNLDFAEKRCVSPRSSYSLPDIITAFDLSALLGRRPSTLSGGERQRAALARTLLTRPKLLLLDEPLAGLDRSKKREILPFIEDLPKRFALPCLYVSHDIEEVSHLADDILVLRHGQVASYGPAIDVISGLDQEPLGGFADLGVLLEGRVHLKDERLGLTQVDVEGTILKLPLRQTLQKGQRVRLRILAKDVAIAVSRPCGVSIRNVIQSKIIDIESGTKTAFADVRLSTGTIKLRSRITRAAAEELGLAAGMDVFAMIKTMSFEGRIA